MIYLDCGFWQGRALEIYQEIGLIDKTWDIYAFEPNPTLDVEADIKKIGLPVKFIKKAVWIDDKGVDFLVSGRPDAARISSEGNPVDSIDFSKFVSELPNEFTVCNMDIEGAEFAVLPQMIQDGSIDKINLLEIEFHHRLMQYKTPQDAQDLIDELVRHRVKVILKVNL